MLCIYPPVVWSRGLCQVPVYTSCLQVVSSRKLTRPLVLKNKRPAGRGTITVSGIQREGEMPVNKEYYISFLACVFLYSFLFSLSVDKC